MPEFKLVSPFQPTGDQPTAIAKLTEGILRGDKYQTLLGATATGKTFVMAAIIEQVQKPTLVIAHNKTLAAQLYSEFREFFPHNAVEYFVSYYDYYQPEAYVPKQDLYIEKDSEINEEIERLRLAATSALLSRRDVVIVASVSCIYGLGSPEEFGGVRLSLKRGETRNRDKVLRHLVEIHYARNDLDLTRGKFRVRGDTLEVAPAYGTLAYRIEFFGDEIERIAEIDTLTGEVLLEHDAIEFFRQNISSRPRTNLPPRFKTSKVKCKSKSPGSKRKKSFWKRNGSSNAPSTISKCCARSGTVAASRTIRARSRNANPARRRGR